MNPFRKVASRCQEITNPETGQPLGSDEVFDSGYAQGQYDLAQELLALLKKTTPGDPFAF